MLKSHLKCPHCHRPLRFNTSWTCGQHHFDQAREGYINLCIPSIKGDDVHLVTAREKFFETNPYQPLMNHLLSWIKPHDVVLDVGCGIGAYLTYFKQCIPSIIAYGCDGSKYAIKRAAKKDPNSHYSVANVKNLPLLSDTCDVIVSVFAPYDDHEIRRCLKPNGIWIKVSPAPLHLIQLKKMIYHEVKLNPNESNVFSNFLCLHEEIYTFEMSLNKEQLHSLFLMTPYAYTSPKDTLTKIQAIETLDVSASFNIMIFAKK